MQTFIVKTEKNTLYKNVWTNCCESALITGLQKKSGNAEMTDIMNEQCKLWSDGYTNVYIGTFLENLLKLILLSPLAAHKNADLKIFPKKYLSKDKLHVSEYKGTKTQSHWNRIICKLIPVEVNLLVLTCISICKCPGPSPYTSYNYMAKQVFKIS